MKTGRAALGRALNVGRVTLASALNTGRVAMVSAMNAGGTVVATASKTGGIVLVTRLSAGDSVLETALSAGRTAALSAGGTAVVTALNAGRTVVMVDAMHAGAESCGAAWAGVEIGTRSARSGVEEDRPRNRPGPMRVAHSSSGELQCAQAVRILRESNHGAHVPEHAWLMRCWLGTRLYRQTIRAKSFKEEWKQAGSLCSQRTANRHTVCMKVR